MFFLTSIGRVTDGLIFVTSMLSTVEAGRDIDTYKDESKRILKSLSSNSAAQMQLMSGDLCFSYIIDENLCFLTLTEKNLSKRIIFTYLEDVKNSFISYLQNEHKDEWRTVLATMARPYAFARFGLSWIRELWLDKEIQQKRRQYDDQNGNLDSYNQINESLIDIQNIMRKNIDEVVQRVEKLDRKCSNSHLE
ncbi:vesicle-trafficking protein [Blastocystis sp. subtype 4]|uniref:vesicle-trafficking protein n=1 Tax=Blastocystis sp. subtype 4 TaxID=944170 RepID=UPI000711350E|nr:vesicle-trafficking protein [Blastocystis sp. subtype 4]KNB41197.1 vesicle-trafficking protein [Blastocystis sp. subtype 4]|eukprot:XP_014524640.1 vesicle-trafficking protein [Blastocystis sp. subtype 4]